MAIKSIDVAMPVVPMFHANAWSLAFSAPIGGAALVMPGPKLDGASIYEMLTEGRVTITAAVPTVWLMLLQYLEQNPQLRLPHLDRVVIGGSACPESIMKAFVETYGSDVIHAWGMTEMSPIGSLGVATGETTSLSPEDWWTVKLKQGRPPFMVDMKITDDEGRALPHDGKTFGRLKVKGPAIARSYYKGEGVNAFDAEGWFDTGDVATIDQYGFMQITDRAKDVIKSGGEWISSIELENIALGCPGVHEAAAIGLPHPRWDERPLLVIVRRKDARRDARGCAGSPRRQGRQVVDAGRRRLRRRDPAHRDGQDLQDGTAGALQGLRFSRQSRRSPARPLARRNHSCRKSKSQPSSAWPMCWANMKP